MCPPEKKIFESGIVVENLKRMTIGKNPAQSRKETRINIEVSDPLGLCQQLAGKLLSDFKFEFELKVKMQILEEERKTLM